KLSRSDKFEQYLVVFLVKKYYVLRNAQSTKLFIIRHVAPPHQSSDIRIRGLRFFFPRRCPVSAVFVMLRFSDALGNTASTGGPHSVPPFSMSCFSASTEDRSTRRSF